MSIIQNKIEANDRSIRAILDNKKYTIDYFQREYNWQKKHIEQLIVDLETSFNSSYDKNHNRKEVANYQSYYLGPIVISKGGDSSIIDGQQRLTSLTLLLIYLNHLQKEISDTVNIKDLIFSEKYSVKSFNIDVPEREKCISSLFNYGEYTPSEDDDESTKNIVERYEDIEEFFPEDLKTDALPYFIDWLIDNVILVEITAYSDDNAYTIFETMNDRGLNLTPSEMLKGFILSKIHSRKERTDVNLLWKESIKKLHEYENEADITFFQSWLRAKYADTIRKGKVGAPNEDFEKIGTRFHTWVRDNQNKLELNSSDDFYNFINIKFKFYLRLYLKIWDAEEQLTPGLEHLYYINKWGIADSLASPLLIAPIMQDDDQETINRKLNLVARFIETFVVLRSVNYRKFSQSSIRYTIYSLVKEIRDTNITQLGLILKAKLDANEEKMDGILELMMHGQNKRFIKFLLCRITSYIEKMSGFSSNFEKYYRGDGKPFEIEHIWANKFDEHKDEFEQIKDFEETRNMLGDLILLPNGTNQSFNSDKYENKLQHYLKENLLAQSLNYKCYEKNPNFISFIKSSGLNFESHEHFKKNDIEKRQSLYHQICEQIWNLNEFIK